MGVLPRCGPVWLRIVGIAYLLLIIAIPSGEVWGETKIVKYSGYVIHYEEVGCWCLLGVYDGGPVSGYYFYDTESVDQDPNPQIGVYPDSLPSAGFVLCVGEHVFMSDPTGSEFSITLHDSVVDDNGLHDSYEIWAVGIVDTVTYYVPMNVFWMKLEDASATALSSDELPQSPPALDDWPTRHTIWIYAGAMYIRVAITWMGGGESTGIIHAPGVPAQIKLFPSRPNPTSGSTEIRFFLDRPSDVRFQVFDVLGRRVYTDPLGKLPSGFHSFDFPGRSQSGALLPSGVYFYSIGSMGPTIFKKFGKLVVTR